MPLEPPRPTVTSVRFETGDRIRITRLATENQLQMNFFAAFLRDDGEIVSHQERLPVLTANNLQTDIFVFTAGYLLNCSIIPAQSLGGETSYATVERIRGGVNTEPNRLMITAGFIGFPAGLMYPHQPPKAMTGIPTDVQQVEITAPAAGSDLNISNFSSQYVNLIGFNATFVASAAAANRAPAFFIDCQTFPLLHIPSRTNITAGQTRQIFWWTGPNLPADNTFAHYYPLPPNTHGNIDNIRTLTAGLDVGDEWQAISLFFAARPWQAIF